MPLTHAARWLGAIVTAVAALLLLHALSQRSEPQLWAAVWADGGEKFRG